MVDFAVSGVIGLRTTIRRSSAESSRRQTTFISSRQYPEAKVDDLLAVGHLEALIFTNVDGFFTFTIHG